MLGPVDVDLHVVKVLHSLSTRSHVRIRSSSPAAAHLQVRTSGQTSIPPHVKRGRGHFCKRSSRYHAAEPMQCTAVDIDQGARVFILRIHNFQQLRWLDTMRR